jgi:hypothetical protein
MVAESHRELWGKEKLLKIFYLNTNRKQGANRTRRWVSPQPAVTSTAFKVVTQIQSAYQEKIPARNAIYAHAQDFLAGDELLLAILKAFIPQPLNKQQTIGFHVF